jgi:hypothetical protein
MPTVESHFPNVFFSFVLVLTQITFELYERKNPDTDNDAEYSLRIAFSPGAHYDSVLDLHM